MTEPTEFPDSPRPKAGEVKLSVPTREGMEQAMRNWDAATPYFEAERKKRLRETAKLYERGRILFGLGLKQRVIRD